MAFFKFRKGGEEIPTPPPVTESVEVLRRRARNRLVGAAVLVLAGVIGFPILFDNQPRPIAVDIPIEIPDKNKVKPLGNLPVAASQAVPVVPASEIIEEGPAPATKSAESTASAPKAREKLVDKSAVKPLEKVSEKSPEKTAEKASEKMAEDASDKQSGKSPAHTDDGAKAQALLEGKSVDKKPELGSTGRFIIQIGAFADAAKARESRMVLERAGLKTYTQVVETKDGKRIRVRVGPFESKADADKVAEKVKKLELSAYILEL